MTTEVEAQDDRVFNAVKGLVREVKGVGGIKRAVYHVARSIFEANRTQEEVASIDEVKTLRQTRDSLIRALKDAIIELERVAHHRNLCRDYDDEAGQTPRVFMDVDEWKTIEAQAYEAVKKARSIVNSAIIEREEARNRASK